MIVTTYCTAHVQSLILQLISSDELIWVSVIEVTVGAGGGPKVDSVKSMNNINNYSNTSNLVGVSGLCQHCYEH